MLEIVCSDIALSLRTLLIFNYTRQVLMIDLEDDGECISLSEHQNVSCDCVHRLRG